MSKPNGKWLKPNKKNTQKQCRITTATAQKTTQTHSKHAKKIALKNIVKTKKSILVGNKKLSPSRLKTVSKTAQNDVTTLFKMGVVGLSKTVFLGRIFRAHTL